jgi:hypothetical protein
MLPVLARQQGVSAGRRLSQFSAHRNADQKTCSFSFSPATSKEYKRPAGHTNCIFDLTLEAPSSNVSQVFLFRYSFLKDHKNSISTVSLTSRAWGADLNMSRMLWFCRSLLLRIVNAARYFNCICAHTVTPAWPKLLKIQFRKTLSGKQSVHRQISSKKKTQFTSRMSSRTDLLGRLLWNACTLATVGADPLPDVHLTQNHSYLGQSWTQSYQIKYPAYL